MQYRDTHAKTTWEICAEMYSQRACWRHRDMLQRQGYIQWATKTILIHVEETIDLDNDYYRDRGRSSVQMKMCRENRGR